ncbi:hypothetical protein [Streptomyces sp. ATexAB-D23]|uniref:hypothetical protein n=1 Tax=unclassified Streptomyces TaxID=2593676 RepID=UPI00037F89A8|nr:hypothetical protein [Streptomyces sp. ATexAB-D23]MYY07298.1 hypothetical protein [Streptomyces sp. SID4913]
MRGRRALGALLPVLLLATATGCGIRATDVVEAGEPATVEVAPAGRLGTLLYFVSSSTASRLLPVVRNVGPEGYGDEDGRKHGGPAGAAAAVALLFQGPDAAEKAAGLRTELPGDRVKIGVELSAQGVQVTLTLPVTGLSRAAREQLICTAARARTADRTEAVTVTGTDGVIGPAHCSV